MKISNEEEFIRDATALLDEIKRKEEIEEKIKDIGLRFR